MENAFMKKKAIKWPPSLIFLFISLLLGGCDFDDDAVMRPSSWAAIFVIAAILLFFYYVFKIYRRK
ncbi:hypothetical protein DXT99_03955 [Pontibacter diazotrophicus]|uniref:Uncharacterized protein n=1 Tax=Pontibacter diazotrophicus TaxID=1400979 RepID=A0A3D8LGL1_9BACT|nr:hypothetical protein DXT99_03955 [Pontibacter diazotrophicus]